MARTAPVARVAADLGGVTITALADAYGSFGSFAACFPHASPELTTLGRRQYAELFEADRWVLPFRAFLIRSAGSSVVVDAGVGPPPNAFLPEAQGWLPSELQAVGVSPDDVDLVVLTHLHVDHVGWCARAGVPFFPRASYVASAVDWRFFEERAKSGPVFADKLRPLERFAVVELVRETAEVAPHLTLRPSPGHTPGHVAVSARGDAREALVVGDVAVHPLQLEHPDLAYLHEEDPRQAATTRRELLEHVADSETIVAAGHLPRGLGRVVRSQAGFGWARLDGAHRP